MRTVLGFGLALSLLVMSSTTTRRAIAQTRAAPTTPTTASPTSSGHHVAIDDPLLTPAPAAPRTVASWSEALALVRGRSTDLKIAYLEVERAEANSRVALGGALPSLNATGDLTHNILNASVPAGSPIINPTGGLENNATQVLPSTYLEGSAVLVQPLFAPRAWHQIATASHAQDVAKLGIDAQKRNIVLGVASALIGVVAAERIAELNRSGLRVALERFTLANDRKTLGGGTQLDVLRSRQDVDAARVTLIRGDESLRRAREALGLALGVPGEVGVAPSISLDGLEQSTRGSCKVTSIDQRADVAAARGKLDLAQSSVTDVKWQFAPTLNGQSTMYGISVDSSPNPIWNIQAVLTVPIWDGGVRYGLLRAANVDANEAEQRLIQTRRDVTVEMEQARRGVEVAVAQRKVDADARATAAETDDLTQLSFRTGQGTSLELVIAAAQLRQAEINLALGDFDLVKARVGELLSRSNCPW